MPVLHIEFVPDRHGYDQRYAIGPHKANVELGWNRIFIVEFGIKKTIEWYLTTLGSEWLEEYMAQNAAWLKKNYKKFK